MSNTLIIGANGFIGASLAKYLSFKKKKTKLLIRNPQKILNFINLHNSKIVNFNYKKLHDYNFNELLHNIENIVIASGPNRKQCNEEYKKSKLLYMNLIKKITFYANKKKIKKVFKISTIHTYDKNSINYSENSLFKGVDNYSKLHIYADNYLVKKKQYTKNIILKLSNCFGLPPYEHIRFNDHNLIYDVCQSAIKHKKIIIKNPKNIRNFISSSNLVKILYKLLYAYNFKKNLILNVGSSKNYYVEEICNIINDVCKKELDFNLNLYIDKSNTNIDKNFNFKLNKLKKLNISNNENMKLEIKKILTNLYESEKN